MKLATTSKSLLENSASDVEWAKTRHAILRANQRKLTNTLTLMNRILDRFDGDKLGVSLWPLADTYAKSASLRVSITVAATSMKIGIVPDVLEALCDYEFDAKKTTDYADGSQAERAFLFDRPATDFHLHIVLEVAAKLQDAEDATCRKIQTGVKTLEVPQYALVCDEA